MIRIVIPLPPMTKKNHQQIIWNKAQHRPMVIQNNKYLKYEKECKKYMPFIATIDRPINLKCVYYMPTHRRVDLTNLLSATNDILVKHKILKDDNRDIVASMDGSMVKYSKTNSRTEIEISEVENYERWKND